MCLDKRKDHWEGVEEDLARLGIFPKRFVMGFGEDHSLAYDHVDRHKHLPLPDRQRLDYAEAVQSLIRRELDRGADHVFISEDDNKLHDLSLPIWAAVLEESEGVEFDVFFLHSVRVFSRTRPVSDHVWRLDSALGFRALVLRKRAMEVVCGLTPSTHKGIDGLFKDAQWGLAIYAAYPCVLRGDRDGWSYQEGRHVLSSWLDDTVFNKGAGPL
jgi:hypothetical protein